MINAVIFDFGGVLAEEGFREGLKEIGRKNGLQPEEFYAVASELVYSTGYVLGLSGEGEYWDTVRKNTRIKGSNKNLRDEILDRFTLRPEMFEIVKELKTGGLTLAILSDQTNWLDEINEHFPFFHLFDHVFNSFHLHKGKRDASLFSDICEKIGFRYEETLFIDDNAENISRARDKGLKVILFQDTAQFKTVLHEKLSKSTD